MSFVSDGIKILNDEAPVFAFLPSINFSYLFIQDAEPTYVLMGLVSVSILFSAALFNFLTNGVTSSDNTVENEDAEEASNEDTAKNRRQSDSSPREGLVFGAILLFWVPLLLKSVYDLFSILENDPIIPEVLLIISVLFICLVVTDSVLYTILGSYGENEST